jgi:protein-export membrane protein SecD
MTQPWLFNRLNLGLLLAAFLAAAGLYVLALTAPSPGKSAEISSPAFNWTWSESYVLDLKLAADFSRLPSTVNPAAALERSVKVFANRTFLSLHAVKPTVRTEGGRFIYIHAPGIKDPDQALKLLTQSGTLEIKLVDENYLIADFVDLKGNLIPGKLPPELELLPGIAGDRTLVESRPLLPENCVEYALPVKDKAGRPAVGFRLNALGASAFADVTTRYLGRQLAVVFNRTVYTVAKVTSPISHGQVIISGDFTREDTEELAASLQAGSLPFPVKVVEKKLALVSPLQSVMALLGIHSRPVLAHLFLGVVLLALLGSGWIGVLVSPPKSATPAGSPSEAGGPAVS